MLYHTSCSNTQNYRSSTTYLYQYCNHFEFWNGCIFIFWWHLHLSLFVHFICYKAVHYFCYIANSTYGLVECSMWWQYYGILSLTYNCELLNFHGVPNFRGFRGGSNPRIPVPTKWWFSVWTIKENIRTTNLNSTNASFFFNPRKLVPTKIKVL